MSSHDRSKSVNLQSAETIHVRNLSKTNRPQSELGPRARSLRSLNDLIKCQLCFKSLKEPRMLPCQHTFCLLCLQSDFEKAAVVKDEPRKWNCPICEQEFNFESKEAFEQMPTNVHIESIFDMLKESPDCALPASLSINVRCSRCQTVCQMQEKICQHCKQIFCQICWTEHVSDLMSKLGNLEKQLDESAARLTQKTRHCAETFEELKASVENAVREKVSQLSAKKQALFDEIEERRRKSLSASKELKLSIDDVKKDVSLLNSDCSRSEAQKIAFYMELHWKASQLLEEVSMLGEQKPSLDRDGLRLNFNLKLKLEPGSPNNSVVLAHYKSYNFETKLYWNKCPRPAGTGIPPWDPNTLYICTTDNKTVLVFDRASSKVVNRLSSDCMSCPQGVAFSDKLKEIYVTDKWNHVVHVFSHSGDYLRTLCGKETLRAPEGLAMSAEESLLYVCDTGNDRVIAVDPEDGMLKGVIGRVGKMTELNMPTGVAVNADKIYVADSRNQRIKVYDSRNGNNLLLEIGTKGREKGQLMSPEVVAVDSFGCILVGDSGNNRVQIFQPDGGLIRVLGESGNTPGKFLWISGITVTRENDVIVSDSKNRSLQIF